MPSPFPSSIPSLIHSHFPLSSLSFNLFLQALISSLSGGGEVLYIIYGIHYIPLHPGYLFVVIINQVQDNFRVYFKHV